MQGWWVLWLRQPKFAETHRFPHRIILLRRHKSFVITKQNTYIISSLLQGNEPLSRTAPTQRNKSVALKKYLGCSPPSTARQRAEQDFVPGQVRQNVFNPCGHSRERGVGKPCLQSCPVTLLEGGSFCGIRYSGYFGTAELKFIQKHAFPSTRNCRRAFSTLFSVRQSP
eukprot:1252577-Rhodomonas_salina.3